MRVGKPPSSSKSHSVAQRRASRAGGNTIPPALAKSPIRNRYLKLEEEMDLITMAPSKGFELEGPLIYQSLPFDQLSDGIMSDIMNPFQAPKIQNANCTRSPSAAPTAASAEPYGPRPSNLEIEQHLPYCGPCTSSAVAGLYQRDELPERNTCTVYTETFACPYFRRAPERHMECINLRMVRISDVKQHLKRRHTAPYYCTRCYKGFVVSRQFCDHVRQESCFKGFGTNFDTVSPDAQARLKTRFNKSLEPREQWYEIWKILFHDHIHDAKPKPQQDNIIKEVTRILRGVWIDEGRAITHDLSKAQGVSPSYNDQLYPLLPGLLDRVEARFEQRTPESRSMLPSFDTEDIARNLGPEPGPQTSSGSSVLSQYSSEVSECFAPQSEVQARQFNSSATATEIAELLPQPWDFDICGVQRQIESLWPELCTIEEQMDPFDSPHFDFPFSLDNSDESILLSVT